MAFRQPLLLPSPLDALARLGELVMTVPFWRAVGRSSLRILSGFLIGSVLGIALAAPSAAWKPFRAWMAPAVAAVKAVPVASFTILALVWLDSRSLAVFIAALMSFPAVYLGVLEGVERTDPKLLEVADAFHVPFRRRVWAVYLPQTLPSFRTAASLSMGLCWKAGAAAEVIGLPSGSLGERLYTSKIYFLTADLFAWTAVIVLLSMGFERLFLLLLDWTAARLYGT